MRTEHEKNKNSAIGSASTVINQPRGMSGLQISTRQQNAGSETECKHIMPSSGDPNCMLEHRQSDSNMEHTKIK